MHHFKNISMQEMFDPIKEGFGKQKAETITCIPIVNDFLCTNQLTATFTSCMRVSLVNLSDLNGRKQFDRESEIDLD